MQNLNLGDAKGVDRCSDRRAAAQRDKLKDTGRDKLTKDLEGDRGQTARDTCYKGGHYILSYIFHFLLSARLYLNVLTDCSATFVLQIPLLLFLHIGYFLAFVGNHLLVDQCVVLMGRWAAQTWRRELAADRRTAS